MVLAIVAVVLAIGGVGFTVFVLRESFKESFRPQGFEAFLLLLLCGLLIVMCVGIGIAGALDLHARLTIEPKIVTAMLSAPSSVETTMVNYPMTIGEVTVMQSVPVTSTRFSCEDFPNTSFSCSGEYHWRKGQTATLRLYLRNDVVQSYDVISVE